MSKSVSRMVAKNRRLGELAIGKQPAVDVSRLKYEQLRDALYTNYKINRKKSMWVSKDVKRTSPLLDTFFAGYRANAITSEAVNRFVLEQQDTGKANARINRSLSALKRMFKGCYPAVQASGNTLHPDAGRAKCPQGVL